MKNRALYTLLILLLVAGCKPEAERQKDLAAAEAAQQASQMQPPAEARIAGVGVGEKGRSLDDINSSNPSSLIAAPAKAYFNVKEKIVFEIQIPQMMNLYKASNGFAPKSHDEFMKELQNNNIVLPKLPEGRVYRYRPDEGELYVEPVQPAK